MTDLNCQNVHKYLPPTFNAQRTEHGEEKNSTSKMQPNAMEEDMGKVQQKGSQIQQAVGMLQRACQIGSSGSRVLQREVSAETCCKYMQTRFKRM